jgi:cytochrome c
MKSLVLAIGISAFLFSGLTMATDEMELAKKSGCMACHSLDKKVVGPAWKDVATKYKGKAGAEEALMEKIAKGGKGNWGPVPMPPYSPRVSDEDIKKLVKYVLSL